MIKVAIIGGTGLLGSNLIKLLSKKYDVKAFSRESSRNVSQSFNNIVDFNFLEDNLCRYFVDWSPDIIINTVAVVDLQQCEDSYSMAYSINCGITAQLAKIASKLNSYFIHISTDHYYNDDLKTHDELQDVTLLNNYAKTKYNAEEKVLENIDNALIVRTNIIGFRRREAKSFFEWLIDSLKKEEKIDLYTNFYTSPISVNQLGEILIKCHQSQITGIYNIASSEVIDKYSFGIKTANEFGFPVKNIIAKELKYNNIFGLKRALTLGLNVSKIERALQIKMPTISETINSLHDEYKDYTNERK
jgi:dTDP-4-dehydrorhamnose reductase